MIFSSLLALMCCVIVFNLVCNALGARAGWRRAQREPLPVPAPRVSVIVPARNEALNIEDCLQSLGAQRYPDFEVICVDDCSEDGTAPIARAVAERFPAVRVIDGEPLPPGWIGKPWACHQAAQHATGDYLLFTDADTVFHPRALEQAVRFARANGTGLMTGLPRLVTVSLWERLSVPVLAFSSATVSYAAINAPWLKRTGVASGAFMLFRREVYTAIGGHLRVQDNIVDDVGLARATKLDGHRLIMTEVAQLVRCRMYRSFGEIWEGFSKNFAKVFPGPSILIPIAGMCLTFIAPWIALAWTAAQGGALWLPALVLVAVHAIRSWTDARMGTPDYPAVLLSPLATLFFSVIALRSWSRAVLRQPTPWRNRSYALWREPGE